MYKSLASLVLFVLTANAGLANAGDCNTLADPGQFADVVTADGSPSDPSGGDVTEGTYVFTGAAFYNTGLPAGIVLGTVGITISIAADMYDSVSQQMGGPSVRESGSVTFDSKTATATITTLCPEPLKPTSPGYSSDGTTVVLLVDIGGGISAEETFALTH